MIYKPLDELSFADLQALVTNEVREGRALEYKGELHETNDDGKREFLADVTSLANAGGGHLVFGIPERQENGKNTGVPESVTGLAGFNPDQDIQRWTQVLLDGVRPRVPGVRTKVIEGPPAGPVLVMHVPRSFATPHMVTFKNLSRFFSRTSQGKFQMDVDEIRHAFLAVDSLFDRVRQYRSDRLQAIDQGTTPRPVDRSPTLVLHVFPLAAVEGRPLVDIRTVFEKSGIPLCTSFESGCTRRYNLDGVLSYYPGDPESTPGKAVYTQIYRNGVIEAVNQRDLAYAAKLNRLAAVAVEMALVRGVQTYVNKLIEFGVAPPFVIMPSILHVAGLVIVPQDAWDVSHEIDRPNLALPEVMIAEPTFDAATELRECFNAMWQAGGWQGSFNYGQDGKWKPRQS